MASSSSSAGFIFFSIPHFALVYFTLYSASFLFFLPLFLQARGAPHHDMRPPYILVFFSSLYLRICCCSSLSFSFLNRRVCCCIYCCRQAVLSIIIGALLTFDAGDTRRYLPLLRVAYRYSRDPRPSLFCRCSIPADTIPQHI